MVMMVMVMVLMMVMMIVMINKYAAVMLHSETFL